MSDEGVDLSTATRLMYAARAAASGPAGASASCPTRRARLRALQDDQPRTVVSGDTIVGIAADACGDGSKHPRSSAANARALADPNLILRIPF